MTALSPDASRVRACWDLWCANICRCPGAFSRKSKPVIVRKIVMNCVRGSLQRIHRGWAMQLLKRPNYIFVPGVPWSLS
jgi:hypothetical protein